MQSCYTVEQIRLAEQPLLAAQSEPDDLMRQAAAAVAEVAAEMLRNPDRPRGRIPVAEVIKQDIGFHTPALHDVENVGFDDEGADAAAEAAALAAEATFGDHVLGDVPAAAPESKLGVLLLVGSGGNGGDALYAGAKLIQQGFRVDAFIFGDNPHARALEAFKDAGGAVLSGPLDQLIWNVSEQYSLLIDGIVGLGGDGPLREEPSWLVREANLMEVPILSIDIPSGISADSGETFPGPVNTLHADPDLDDDIPAFLPGHVTASVTVTFGGLRYAHAVAEDCGALVVADIALPNQEEFSPLDEPGMSLGQILYQNSVYNDEVWNLKYIQAVPEYLRFGDYDYADRVYAPIGPELEDMEPRPQDDKYSGGVVGIAAGSERYPGAAILSTTGAVRATSSAVHYFGGCRQEVVRALPSVVSFDEIDKPRVNAWVVGPGRGTNEKALDELEALLLADEPLVIDADAVTLLARNVYLQGLVRERATRRAATVVTPHAGEFNRLRAGLAGHPSDDGEHAPLPESQLTGIPDPERDPIGAAKLLSEALNCIVLLKGHRTVVATPPWDAGFGYKSSGQLSVIDAGSSWAATPGSGDVLSGIIGAWLARYSDSVVLGRTVETAVVIHAQAAELAARTPYGHAPTDSHSIAQAIPSATAIVLNMSRGGGQLN